jgi:ABC-type uncharacterized transport system permease subunit
MRRCTRSTDQKTVALLVETSRAYGRGICRGVARFAEQNPDWLILYQERNLKESIPESLRKYKVDGILMRVDQPSVARKIVSLGIPTVDLLGARVQVSIECIVAIGMTILLVSGGFDLSVGSTFAFAGAMTAMTMSSGLPPWAALLVGLVAGAVIGFCNGFIIAQIGINPFVTTLAMMSMVRGMLLVITRGRNISGLPESFRVIGQGNVHGVQNPIWIALLMVLVGDILLRKSRFFRQNYYLGGNERAAMLSGIRIDRLKIFNYSLTGLLAAFAGIIMTARLGAASVTARSGAQSDFGRDHWRCQSERRRRHNSGLLSWVAADGNPGRRPDNSRRGRLLEHVRDWRNAPAGRAH